MYNKSMAMDRKKKVGMKKIKKEGNERNKKKYNVVKGNYLEGGWTRVKKKELSKCDIPVCSYLCLRRELVFWNVLSHKSHAYIPLSVFLIFFRASSDSLSVRSSSPDR